MGKHIRIVVIDDEALSRDELIHLLKRYKDIHIAAEADSGEKGLEKIITEEPDVIFVDIEMGDMSGLELVSAIQKIKKPPLVIFATAYPDYAAKAFRYQALDYLLKPFDEEQLEDTMERIHQELTKKTLTPTFKEPTIGKLAVEDEGKIVYLIPEEIIYFYREERETIVCTKDKSYRMKTSLKELEQKLVSFSFFRTHKSYFVNLNSVKELIPWFNGAYQIKLFGSTEEIPVSRNYVKALREHLEL
ncbi:LytR/AlgR family response regulator transcription factor [Bacillus taeanensis]|uniref:DNA-binding response regulator n=1 Tax=Bacillus taeanensis TaxID=273032 RepID=A0A366XZZ1_9BACI|nr:LytTR family DNA-binding domain-containing protein [Bacillus taeanensis]RBW71507.1 DNA-binding response regulator [Bacillus taeanensis]